MADVRDALIIGKNTAGANVRRPMSPHLQVYRPQISSALSIFHRLTGIALSVGSAVLVWWLVAAASGPHAYAVVSGFLRSPVGLIVLFGWTVALWYHFFAGIRHLVWDMGYGYSKPNFHASGWATLAATAVSSVLTWAVGLWVQA